MNNNRTIIIACVLVGVGAIMAGVGYLSGGYKSVKEFKGFSIGQNIKDNSKCTKKDEELSAFKNIDLDVDYGDVEIVKGDNYRIVAEYNEKYEELSYEVKGDKLIVKNKQIANMGINNFNNFEVKVYVPKDAELDNLNLKVNCGKLILDDLKCNEIYASNDFGNIKGKNIDTNKFEGNLESGSLELNKFKADNAVIKNQFGDIKGKELCTNGLDINIESGKVDIAGKFSGKNSVDSEFGKVIIENDLKKEECGYDVDVEFGKFVVDGKKFVNDHESYNESSDNNFKIKCSSGDVELDFNK